MGVVWRAHDLVLGREVAVKEVAFPADLPDTERHSAQARVTREARAAARLNHQAVVTLYDVVTHPGGVLLVMELVEAPTLAELVRVQGPLAPERVAEIGAQLAGAWRRRIESASCIAMSSRATCSCLQQGRSSWRTSALLFWRATRG